MRQQTTRLAKRKRTNPLGECSNCKQKLLEFGRDTYRDMLNEELAGEIKRYIQDKLFRKERLSADEFEQELDSIVTVLLLERKCRKGKCKACEPKRRGRAKADN